MDNYYKPIHKHMINISPRDKLDENYVLSIYMYLYMPLMGLHVLRHTHSPHQCTLIFNNYFFTSNTKKYNA